MNDKYHLDLFYKNITWQTENRSDIEIDIKYNDNLNYKYQETHHIIDENNDFNTVMKAMKKEIDKINHKQFMNIGSDSYEVTVKASQKNIKILQDNMNKY